MLVWLVATGNVSRHDGLGETSGVWGNDFMGWQTKGRNGRYYYASIRDGNRPRKIYLGRGSQAEEHARQVEQRRQERLERKEALHREQAQLAVAEQHLHWLRQLADLIVKAVMLTGGYYQHHGQWRRRNGGKDSRGGG